MTVVNNKYRGSKEYFLGMALLVATARCRGVVTYQRLAVETGLPDQGSAMGNETGKLLGAIAEDEVLLNRPMLSAVAVGVSGEPGTGFFALAKSLGLFKGQTKEEERAFWEMTRDSAYEAWAWKPRPKAVASPGPQV